MFKITCLKVVGGPIRGELGEALYRLACRMLSQGSKSGSEKYASFEVSLRTDFKATVLGSLSGIEFEALVESDSSPRSMKVRFLVDPPEGEEDDDNGDSLWVSMGPNPLERARSASLNRTFSRQV